MNILIRIEAPHYVAGIEMIVDSVRTDIVRCAPIVNWMKRKKMSMGDIDRYCERKGYKYS